MTSTKKCMKLSSKEYKKIGLLVIPPLLFTIATIAIISGDQLFASFIDVMKEHGKFGITFTGMNHGIELNGLLSEVENGTIPMLDLQLEAFDLSTDPCLPVSVKTDWKKLLPLILLEYRLSKKGSFPTEIFNTLNFYGDRQWVELIVPQLKLQITQPHLHSKVPSRPNIIGTVA